MIVGIDLSSHRIDLAWVEGTTPCRWHQDLGKGNLIDRLRRINIYWPRPIGWDVTEVAIEYPHARGAGVPALWSVVGILTRQAPPWARVSWPDPRDLRAAIGAKNNKVDAHEKIHEQWDPLDDWTEDELDALVVCVGWKKILEGNE